jgi:hypothetical protein
MLVPAGESRNKVIARFATTMYSFRLKPMLDGVGVGAGVEAGEGDGPGVGVGTSMVHAITK